MKDSRCCASELKLKDACGVFGVYSFNGANLAKPTYYGLFSLQHRGQESAGIYVSDGRRFKGRAGMGLVNMIFNEDNLKELTGHIAIGHVRYSTTGSSILENAQPFVIESKFGPIAVAHNGNLINTKELRDHLPDYKFKGTTDTEIIAALLANSPESDFEAALIKTLAQCRGAFSLIIMTNDKLVAVRDPHGIRPLSIGKLDDAYVFSSETCGLDVVGAVFVRDVDAGELVIIDAQGLRSKTWSRGEREAMCVFEFIYFARPDSLIKGRSFHDIRVHLGKYLAVEQPANADMVIAVPDSGIPAAIGYASESGIPFSEGLIKNRYIGRTFIQPTQALRDIGVKMKLNPIRDAVRGRKIVLMDDSIVRGTTSRQIVRLLRDCGAREVHFRVSSPPIMHSCFYGIDTPSRADLIAANLSVEGIRKYIEADSLGYLSLKSLTKAINLPADRSCLACLNGEYPVNIPERLQSLKLFFE
ncbi:amidophosphoribosyltransferase [Candidatus Saganbacteria bacterium]|nr:amidophosphoribosyltransferase [Candidatus Saganbacteria bacterium]